MLIKTGLMRDALAWILRSPGKLKSLGSVERGGIPLLDLLVAIGLHRRESQAFSQPSCLSFQ